MRNRVDLATIRQSIMAPRPKYKRTPLEMVTILTEHYPIHRNDEPGKNAPRHDRPAIGHQMSHARFGNLPVSNERPHRTRKHGDSIFEAWTVVHRLRMEMDQGKCNGDREHWYCNRSALSEEEQARLLTPV
jgi:hypothetical protein